MRAYADTPGDGPAYLALAHFLRKAIDDGRLQSGTSLPSERVLAEWASVSRTTVQGAYRALEEAGYAETRPNVGTVVRPSISVSHDADATFRRAFARHATTGPGNFLLDLMRSNDRFRRYGFAAGMADPELFPLHEFQLVLEELLTTRTRDLLAYGLTEGQLTLRERIVDYLKRYRGIDGIGPENVLVTTGSMQALNLVARAFIEPGDVVALENPTFPGAILVFINAKAKLVPVTLDECGLNIDDLSAALGARGARGAKLLYVQPTLQNPTGVSMTAERRGELCSLCLERHTIIVEDDAYGILDASPGSAALYADRRNAPMIYVGTFSKLITPGLRVGFVVADVGVIRELALLKQVADLHSSGMSQSLVEGWLAIGNVDAYVEKCRETYVRRLKAALADSFFVENAEVPLLPQGGFYIFGRFKHADNSRRVRDAAQTMGVSFALGENFSVSGELPEWFRLSVSTMTERSIHVGLLRLQQVLKRVREPIGGTTLDYEGAT
jgi:2-aminoadipate transaminase